MKVNRRKVSDPLINPNSEDRHKTYQDLLDEFGAEIIENTYIFLLDRAKYFLSFYVTNFNIKSEDFKISETYLKEAVIDYFADIKRLKPFHNIMEIHPLKRAAYLGYWLVRRKPIQILYDFSQEELTGRDRLISINESFAISIMMAVIYIHSHSTPKDYNENVYKFLHQMHYHLKYRVISPQVLELALVGFYTNQLYPCQAE